MSAPFDPHDTPLPLSYYEQKYQLSRVTLWRYRRAGLPALDVGNKVYVRESEWVAFLQKMNGRTVSATPTSKEGGNQ